MHNSNVFEWQRWLWFFLREEELWASMQSNRFVSILFAVGLVVALTFPRSGEQLYVARRV